MLFSLRHHKIVIDTIYKLFSQDINVMVAREPLTTKARDAGVIFFGRRPDLAPGCTLSTSSSGGLHIEIIRNAGQYILDIAPSGRLALVSGGMRPVSLTASSVNCSFLGDLETVLPDPFRLKPEKARLDFLSGEISKKADRASLLKTDGGNFIGSRISKPVNGFEWLCVQHGKITGKSLNDFPKILEAAQAHNSNARIMAGREFMGTGHMFLTDIKELPKECQTPELMAYAA